MIVGKINFADIMSKSSGRLKAMTAALTLTGAVGAGISSAGAQSPVENLSVPNCLVLGNLHNYDNKKTMDTAFKEVDFDGSGEISPDETVAVETSNWNLFNSKPFTSLQAQKVYEDFCKVSKAYNEANKDASTLNYNEYRHLISDYIHSEDNASGFSRLVNRVMPAKPEVHENKLYNNLVKLIDESPDSNSSSKTESVTRPASKTTAASSSPILSSPLYRPWNSWSVTGAYTSSLFRNLSLALIAKAVDAPLLPHPVFVPPVAPIPFAATLPLISPPPMPPILAITPPLLSISVIPPAPVPPIFPIDAPLVVPPVFNPVFPVVPPVVPAAVVPPVPVAPLITPPLLPPVPVPPVVPYCPPVYPMTMPMFNLFLF